MVCVHAVVDWLIHFSLHQLDIRQHPCPVEVGLRGAVEPEVGEPAFARQGLDPVLRRLASGRFGSEKTSKASGSVRLCGLIQN